MSEDAGKSWGDEQIIRTDGGTPDIGYPKAVVLSGGELLLVYYFNDGLAQERYIASSRVAAAVAT